MRAGARKAAKIAGLPRYSSGKPCVKGHLAERFTSNGTCVECYVAWRAAVDKKRLLELGRKRRRENADKYREQCRKNRRKNPELHSARTRAWRKRNPDYLRNKRRNDVNYRLTSNLRSRLKMAIKNNYKGGSAVRDLGCSIADLKIWLELQFTPGMSWDNYGEWHIDHKKPLSAFDLSNRDHITKACHWTNLQPLWAKDNLSKGSSHAGGSQ